MKIISPAFCDYEFVAGLRGYMDLFFPLCRYSVDMKDALSAIMRFVLDNQDMSQYPLIETISDTYDYIQDIWTMLNKRRAMSPMDMAPSCVIAFAGLFHVPSTPLIKEQMEIHIRKKARSPPESSINMITFNALNNLTFASAKDLVLGGG